MEVKSVLVLGAMEEEIEHLRKWSHAASRRLNATLEYWEGEAASLRVYMAWVGVGKALAAINTQRLVDELQPDILLFVGIAGGLNPEYNIGDLVLAEDCVQHDLDARPLGFSLGTIPYTELRYFPGDTRLLDLAQKFPAPMGKTCVGRVLTGDQFIDASHREAVGEKREILGGDCMEMEGAAVALCAQINGIPHLVARTISDKVDEQASVDYNDFLPRAGEQNAVFVEWLLEALAAGSSDFSDR